MRLSGFPGGQAAGPAGRAGEARLRSVRRGSRLGAKFRYTDDEAATADARHRPPNQRSLSGKLSGDGGEPSGTGKRRSVERPTAAGSGSGVVTWSS